MSTIKYVVVDTETSGVGKTDTVLQLAYQTFDAEGKPLDWFSGYFAPPWEYEIHPEALKVNGLTKEFILEKGYRGSQIHSRLDRIRIFALDGAIIVGHNISFDLRMIRQDMRRYGITEIHNEVSFCTKNNREIKSYVGATDINNNPKAPSLAELHTRLFGESIQGAHDALADVRATSRCFFELKRLGIVAV